MPDTNVKSQQKPSFIQNIIKIIATIGNFTIILCVILILMIPAIYYFGSYTKHQVDPHPLYNLFDTSQYIALRKNLAANDTKKFIVTGDFKAGLKQFLDHFANLRTSKGNQVIINEIYSNDIPIIPYLRQLKHLIEDQLDMESNKFATWIIIDENQFPAQQLGLIIARHPKDRFIVAVDEKVKLGQNNAFKKYVFPPLSVDKFKHAVVTQLKLPAQNIEPIYKFYGIQGIFEVIDEDVQGLVPENILGQYYRSISILTNADKQVAQKLCNQGPQKSKDLSNTLKGFGTLIFEEIIYWKNKLAQLNYELSVKIVCSADAVVPNTVLEKIEQIQRKKRQKQMQKAKASKKSKGKK